MRCRLTYIFCVFFFSIAAACYTVHYVKRLLETIFVHRFSHSTMPLRNLFKNCSYYWGFTAYVSYHVNHPYFTSPCMCQVWAALALFAVSLKNIIIIFVVVVNIYIVSMVRRIGRWGVFIKTF